ncbi:hypothetical protein OQA88_3507 [Cercophora sp. LCS_1]
MDDPGDPCWSWPHWKFGLKRDDLFTKLHDQYNTIPSAIQDPEAFHHDVYEISNEATSTDEFYRLLKDRKEQRLQELNQSLESAALEIIGNPSFIGSEQWQYAAQLFRTKSLDSLVRYFASYLPPNHAWHNPANPSFEETGKQTNGLPISHGSFFNDASVMVDEPYEMSASYKALLPPSPRSMTTCSDSSVASPDFHDYDINTFTPPRTLSYSESEPDLQDDDCPKPCGGDLPASSESLELREINPDVVDNIVTATRATEENPADTVSLFTTSNTVESETPTPKPECQSASFFESKPSLPHRRHRIAPRPTNQRDALSETETVGMHVGTEE